METLVANPLQADHCVVQLFLSSLFWCCWAQSELMFQKGERDSWPWSKHMKFLYSELKDLGMSVNVSHVQTYKKNKVNHCIRVYLSIIQRKSHELACNPKGIFLGWLDTRISFKDPKLVYLLRSFESNQQQLCKESSFCVGWMRVRSYTENLSLSLSLSYCIDGNQGNLSNGSQQN